MRPGYCGDMHSASYQLFFVKSKQNQDEQLRQIMVFVQVSIHGLGLPLSNFTFRSLQRLLDQTALFVETSSHKPRRAHNSEKESVGVYVYVFLYLGFTRTRKQNFLN